jgi:hypothetical protein
MCARKLQRQAEEAPQSAVHAPKQMQQQTRALAHTPASVKQRRLQDMADRSPQVKQLMAWRPRLNPATASVQQAPVQRLRYSNSNTFYGPNRNPLSIGYYEAKALTEALPENEFDTHVTMFTHPDEGLKWVEILSSDVDAIAYQAGLYRSRDQGETDDDDHGAEDADTEEQLVDWSEITSSGMNRLHQQGVLYNIFLNLAQYHIEKANGKIPDKMPERFSYWMQQGVFTRGRFKRLMGLTDNESDSSETIQFARSGNSYSINGDYTGPSNGQDYDNVIYYRDGDGNIDFRVNPAKIVSKYNKFSGDKIKASSIDWSYPVDDGSKIQMSTDLKNPKEGVMPSGKKVNLPKASRGQHFAIADMLYPNSRKSTWTWHHLSDKYKMVLVDMRVHAKHGHNGGVHIW